MPSRGSWISRRRLLMQSIATGAGAVMAAPAGGGVAETPHFLDYPFSLGVASGEPLSDGFVIWTRLAPDPFDPDALDPVPIAVEWLVAEDPGLNRLVRRGQVLARPQFCHSVHVELRGLVPDRPYWYGFRAGGVASPIGRARTAPIVGAPLNQFRFAFASCQHYEQGFFTPYRHMVADDPDLIVHLGDYIYENPSTTGIRRHEGPVPTTLDEYRNRHALYKLDPDLQAAHAHCPWLMTWDDHEVDNDYAGLNSQDFEDPEVFRRRRAAAYRAYYEHMPLRRSALPRDDEMRLYQRYMFGDLVTFNVLDGRQYRSNQACPRPGFGGGQVVSVAECAELLDLERTMLGPQQERWLTAGLMHSRSRWTVIAQQSLFAPFNRDPGDGEMYWTENWSGYGPARDRILATLRDYAVPNPVIIGGDMHAFWVTNVHADHRDPHSPVLAAEFVGTSISSYGPPMALFEPLLPRNPHVKFFDSRSRGYVLVTLTPQVWQSALRITDDARSPGAGIRTLATFAVIAGRPGVAPA